VVLALAATGCGARGDDAASVSESDEPVIAQQSAAIDVAPTPPVFPAPLPWAPAPQPRSASIAAPPAIGALAAVVVDEASGSVIYDKDAFVPLPPASLTKIATLILALEDGRLDDWVTVDVDSTAMRGSTIMGLLPGDSFTMRDLLYGMILPSGNDATLAIGRYVAGSDVAFVARMNQLATRLGLKGSHFSSPHGLGGTDHVTSAYDLAMLSRYGMTLPGFREVVTAGAWTARGSRTIPLASINSFLFSYAGADGLKTGYTRRAGPTLAASAARNGHRLYAVVLNSPSRESDARRLLDWAFANLVWPA
jgi:D-alanyl-D-alanine carboxypeptidase (penicillin-binding protein 5/6)